MPTIRRRRRARETSAAAAASPPAIVVADVGSSSLFARRFSFVNQHSTHRLLPISAAARARSGRRCDGMSGDD